MLRIMLIVALAYSASAGVISPAVSYASGPALGAPLLGSVTYNAPEVTVVKQPITIDQPVVQYRSVPTLVQPHVVVQHQPAVVHQQFLAQPLLAHNVHHQQILV